jgi:hypothetical protein
MTTNVVTRFSVAQSILIGWYGLGIFNARRVLPRRAEEHEGWTGIGIRACGLPANHANIANEEKMV